MIDEKKRTSVIAFVMTVIILLSSMMPVRVAEGSDLPDVTFLGTDSEWEALREQAKNRQRNVIYDNDGDDTAAFPNGKEPSIEGILALRTSFLNKYPVDNITYSITRGGFDYLITPTTKGEPFYVDVAAYQNLTKWLHDQGTDALKLQINYARENNKEIFAQIRVNDSQHDVYDRGPNNPHPLFSPFKRQHPELLLGANYYLPDGINQGRRIGHWSGYNFGAEEVRNRFYHVVDEILTNYASDDQGLDGITLNFHRDGVLFKSMADGNDVTQEERDSWTALLKRIRDRAEEIGKMRGRPILIAVKVPDSVAYSKAAGIDLTEWLNQRLVDLVIGGLHVDAWEDMVALCRNYGVKYYATVEPEWYYPESGATGTGGGIPLKRNVNERYYAQILAAKKAGVDGIEFFNMFYENQVRDIMSIVTEEELAYKNKRYFPTPYISPFQEFWLKNGNSYSKKLSRLTSETPIAVLPGVGNELVLEVGDSLQEAIAAGVTVDVKVAIYGKIPKPEDLLLKIGAHPFTYLNSADNNVHYYSVPADALSVGLNRITLSMSDSGSQALMSETIMKGDVQLTAAYRPWRRMLMPGQGGGESIVNGTLRITDPGADGRPSLHYPLADFPGGYTENNPFIANFSVMVESASEERAVVFYVADGRYVTEVSFMPDKVSFMGTTESYSMNTTDMMHKYQLKITDTKAYLYADGGTAPILETTLSEERKVFSSNEMMFMDKTDLVGNVDRHGLLFGSLSYEGSSKAYWKDIELVRPENSAWISDMYLQIQYGNEQMKPRELANDWQYTHYTSGAGMWTLAAGNWKWLLPYLAAEVELEVASGEAEITFSNGGELIQQIVAPQMTKFNPTATRPTWSAESGDTRRVEIGTGTNAENRFYSLSSPEHSVVTSSKLNVSQWLKDNEGLYPAGSAAYNVIRNGGVLVRKLSEESQVTVKAMRASIGNDWLYKKQIATVTMSDRTVTYNGEPRYLTAIAPTGKMMEYRYKGIGNTEYAESAIAPVHTGTYEVTARIVDTQYTGSAKAVLTIEKARPTAGGVTGTLLKGQSLADASLSGVFKGVKNEQLTGTLTWGDGDEFVPAEAGEFAYTFTASSPDYLPLTGIMTVNVNNLYTIVYDANGGEGAMTESTGISAGTSGAAITLPTNEFIPPEGMQFKEWAIGSIDGDKVSAGSTYTFTANTTVYAIWEDSTPPALPVITANTEEPVVTGVTITIAYPPDAAVKQVKIGEGDRWTDYAGPFGMTVNDSVYARAVDAAGNASGIAVYTVGNIAGELSVSKAKPGKPDLSSDNGYDTVLQDGSYTITMNLYYGDNGRIYRLYENDVLIETRVIDDHTPNAQRLETAVAGRLNGTYRYYAELTNSFGTTRSDTLTVVVTQAAPTKPVLSNDNWDGDGSFEVRMDMWWGTNGEIYHLYENDVLIASIPLAEHSPDAQTATVTLTGRQRGSYEYRGELVNYAGAVSSDTMTVRVTK